MVILVTGGAGFIGSHLAKHLEDLGHSVRVLDSFVHDQPQGLDVIRRDVRDADAVMAAAHGCDAIVHLASIAGVGSVGRDPVQTMDVAFNGTKNVLEAAAAFGIKVVNFSSSEVYGKDAAMVHEDDATALAAPTHTRWGYGAAKLAAEHLCLAYNAHRCVDVCSFRIFNTYGQGQLGDGAVRNFMRRARAGEPLLVRGDGTSVRTWCHVFDTVNAVVAALTADAHVTAGEVFNIGNPHTLMTTRELAIACYHVVARKPPEIKYIGSEADVRVRIPDISKAQDMLGWRPVVELVAGLQLAAKEYA